MKTKTRLIATIGLISTVFVVALPQQTDTSSYFPLGMWGIWIDTRSAPFTGDPNWPLEQQNWRDIQGNYLVYWIPMWVEQNVMNFADANKYKMDIANFNYWYPSDSMNSNSLCYWMEHIGMSDTMTAIRIIDTLRTRWANRPGFYNYTFGEETPAVNPSYWPRVEFLSRKIHEMDSTHKSVMVTCDPASAGPFLNACPSLDIMPYDCYFFGWGVPRSYTAQDSVLSMYVYRYNMLMSSTGGRRTEWQLVGQSQREDLGNGNSNPRRLNLYELKAQTYLALSRGARGVTHYVYGSYVPGAGAQASPSGDAKRLGLLHGTQSVVRYGLVDGDRLRYTSISDPEHIPVFDNMASLYWELRSIGPTLRKLRIYDAFPNTAIPSNNIAAITSVSGDKIEIGVFKRIDQGTDSTVHFMLVNRVCNNEDGSVSYPQSVTVSFNNSVPCGFKDVASGEIWAFQANGSFVVTLDPGKGRLFAKMEYQAALLGLAVQGKSINSAATAYNGQRKSYRESSGKLHEVFASGTIDAGEIFYRNSTDNGASWNNTTRLSDGTATSLAPCITVGPGPTVIVAWQQKSGSNYNVAFSRSTSGGSSWSGISTIQSNFSCASPGPLPSVSANINTASAFVVYRTSSDLKYVYSTGNMGSWNGPYAVPNTNGNYNSPTTGFYPVASPMADKCNLAFSTSVGYPSRLYYGYYWFGESSWSNFTDLSNALPSGYREHRNPSLAVSATSTTTVHVAWEATLMGEGGPPTPVLVHRKGSSGNFGSQYYVIQYQSPHIPSITGLTSDDAWMVFQNSVDGKFYKIHYHNSGGSWIWENLAAVSSGNYAQLSVGSSNAKYLWTSGTSSPYTISVGTETLNKAVPLAVTYSRELNLIEPKTGSSISLQMKEAQAVYRDGTIALIPFVDAPPDSVVIGTQEILNYGNTESFAPSKDVDTLKLQYSFTTVNPGDIIRGANAAFSFDLYDATTEKVIATIGRQAIAQTADTISGLCEVSIPVASFQNSLQGTAVSVHPSLAGLAGDSPDLIASLGHIFRYGTDGASQLPKAMLAETIAPKENVLEQNYPNPFNPVTQFRYSIVKNAYVTLKVFDMLGRQVATLVEGSQVAGYHSVTFDGSKLSSGAYLTSLSVSPLDGGKPIVQTRKVLLMK